MYAIYGVTFTINKKNSFVSINLHTIHTDPSWVRLLMVNPTTFGWNHHSVVSTHKMDATSVPVHEVGRRQLRGRLRSCSWFEHQVWRGWTRKNNENPYDNRKQGQLQSIYDSWVSCSAVSAHRSCGKAGSRTWNTVSIFVTIKEIELVGGLEHVLFSHVLGIIIPID